MMWVGGNREYLLLASAAAAASLVKTWICLSSPAGMGTASLLKLVTGVSLVSAGWLADAVCDELCPCRAAF